METGSVQDERRSGALFDLPLLMHISHVALRRPAVPAQKGFPPKRNHRIGLLAAWRSAAA